MSAPICKVHGTEMKAGRNGGFYCPRKVGDAWCSERVSAPKSGAGIVTAPSVPAQHVAAGLALDFASRVFQGTADASGALDLASQVLTSFFKGTES